MSAFRNDCQVDGAGGDASCRTTDAMGSASGPVQDLMKKWGYGPLLEENSIEWPERPYWVHATVGAYIFIVGKT